MPAAPAQAYGKGKVKPRQAAAAKGVDKPAIIALDAVSHEDRLRGVRETDPLPRYPEHITDSDERQIPRMDWKVPLQRNQALTRIRDSLPVVICNSPFLGDMHATLPADRKPGVVGTWSFDHLTRVASPKRLWPCMISASGKRRFIPHRPEQNVYGSFYHVREPETEAKEFTMAEFVQCARTWNDRHVMLEATLAEEAPAAAGGVAGRAASAGVALPPVVVPPEHGQRLGQDVEGLLDWRWLQEGIQDASTDFGGVRQVLLTLGVRDCLEPAHYAHHEGFLGQVTGRRRVLLMSPEQSFRGLYPFPVAHPYDGQSMVDFDAPDMAAWPLFSKVKGSVTILQPGDLLYVPTSWWRHVQELDRENSCLEVVLDQGRRVRRDEAVPLALGRTVEDWAVQHAGVQGSKRWLQRVAAGREREDADLSTFEGYNAVVAGSEIRDEIEEQLGDGTWHAFLLELIDRRLDATPWLNRNFREPLYLLDKPVYLEDTRTEVELKYPQLFAGRLLQEGYKVEETPISLMNPSHPEFVHKAALGKQRR